MWRLCMTLTMLGLAGSGVACTHTCGICDCTWKQDPCAYYAPCYTGDYYAVPNAPAMRLPSSYHELPPPVRLLAPEAKSR